MARTVDELIEETDRAGLNHVVNRLLRDWARGVPTLPPTADELLTRFGQMYVDARVQGLCHEGAVEVFETGVREYQLALTTAIQSCSFDSRS